MKITLGGEDVLNSLELLSINQSVGAHHHFELHLSYEDRAEHFRGSLSEYSKKWIGKSFNVEEFFSGVVTSVGLSRARTGGSSFIIRGQSPTVHVDDGPHTRSFGNKTLKQILDEVIESYENKFSDINFKPQYTSNIKYVVQYRESNFEFINRLAARYGEWFYYNGLKLFLGKPNTTTKIRLNFERDLSIFDISVKSVPVNFKLMGYDYKNHEFPQKEAEYDTPKNEYAKIALDKSKNEVFPQKNVVPIHFGMNKDDLGQIAQLRQNVHLSEMVVVSGASTNQDLRIGSIIEIIDPRSELQAGGNDNYGTYIVTRLTHEIFANGETYSNQFEAIPAESAIPPLSISPDPPLSEMQIAEVMENNDEKSLGRVRVQFIWQKEAKGEDSKTPWIRVAAAMGGGDKGFYMIPEKGDQVLVAFEHNNPERPFVLMPGMYHKQAKPEHHDAENLKKSIKTKGGHQILMNDEKGKESMALSSPSDFSAAATNGNMNLSAKGTITIKSDNGEITIDTPATIKIHAKTIEINADSSITLGAPKIEIKADAELKASAAKVSVEGEASADFKGNGKVNVESAGVTTITGSMLKLN